MTETVQSAPTSARERPEDAIALPLTIDQIDEQFLTRALDCWYPGVTVERVDIGRTMPGSATKVRLLLDYDDAGHRARLPATMMLKAGFDETMLALAAPMYAKEAIFFRSVAPTLDIPLPRCYYAGCNPDTGQSLLLLEDLLAANVSFGRVEEPLTRDTTAEALELLAAVHARYWDRTHSAPVADLGQLDLGRYTIVDFLLGPENWQRCIDEGRGEGLPESMRDQARVHAGIRSLRAIDERGTHCLLHGDAHIGNMYFEPDGQPRFLDWQAAVAGSWDQDVSYLITCVLDAEDRRTYERELVEHYVGELRARGVEDSPSSEDAWRAHRRQVLYGIVGLFCTPEMQPAEFATRMGTRFAVAADDLGSLELLEADA